MIKAIVFDIDNTLLDFYKLKKASIEHAVEDMIDAGLPLSKSRAVKGVWSLYDKYGWEDKEIFQKFLQKAVGYVDWKILARGIVAYRRIRTGYLDTYPHVFSTLLKLKENSKKLAVLSDAPKLKAYIRLAALNVTDFFDVIVTLEDTGVTKPAKKPFLEVLRQLKTRPEETLMVGDWPDRDIKGAKSVGMKTCLAMYGQNKITSNNTIKPDYAIRDFIRILKIVQ